jgi:hypothetical protein
MCPEGVRVLTFVEENRVKTLLALAGATAALTVGAALAAAAPQTMSFTSVTVSQKQTKSGFSSDSNDLAGGKKVGTDHLKCTFTSKNKASCMVTVIRPKGTIAVAFTTSGNATGGPLKITGGTGTWKGAGGTGTYKNLNKDGSKTAVTLMLK